MWPSTLPLTERNRELDNYVALDLRHGSTQTELIARLPTELTGRLCCYCEIDVVCACTASDFLCLIETVRILIILHVPLIRQMTGQKGQSTDKPIRWAL